MSEPIEILPPARLELDEESTIRLTNREAWALWDYLQRSDAPPYWELGLSNLASRLKAWIVEEAPWGVDEPPGEDVEIRR